MYEVTEYRNVSCVHVCGYEEVRWLESEGDPQGWTIDRSQRSRRADRRRDRKMYRHTDKQNNRQTRIQIQRQKEKIEKKINS